MSTFVRLLGFLRPYRAGATWSLVLAAFAMGATVAIPWLTGLGIDAVTRAAIAGTCGCTRAWWRRPRWCGSCCR